MRTLLIDDLRRMPVDMVARDFESGIWALKNEGPFDILYLDHDLGQDHDGNHFSEEIDGHTYVRNGYGIMCFLENNPQLLPKTIEIVSSNPVGVKKMQTVIDKLYKEKV